MAKDTTSEKKKSDTKAADKKSEKKSSEKKSSDKKGSDKKGTEKKERGKVGKWFHDLKTEFKKVVWPSKQTVLTNTSVVVGVVALSAALVGLLDTGFLAVLRFIYK